jgi:hypothetical protein
MRELVRDARTANQKQRLKEPSHPGGRLSSDRQRRRVEPTMPEDSNNRPFRPVNNGRRKRAARSDLLLSRRAIYRARARCQASAKKIL